MALDRVDTNTRLQQLVPIGLTIVILVVLIAALYGFIGLLNTFTTEKLSTSILLIDVLVGATIYLKTAIDFAIFMGRLMGSNPGWRNRVAIEAGTALGNFLGTIAILTLWVFVKDVTILLGFMIFLAALVLFELAQAGVIHFSQWTAKGRTYKLLHDIVAVPLRAITNITIPLLHPVMPNMKQRLRGVKFTAWRGLLYFSFTVPFVLGLDDFAGYVPLFNVIRIFSFAIGVFAAHTLLNIALFANPQLTTRAVKNPWVSWLGTIAFIAIALFGFVEIYHLFAAG